jgi:hypothetical protein
MPTANPKAPPNPKVPAKPKPEAGPGFAKVIAAFATDNAVAQGSMFGAISLTIGGKGFVMQTKKGELVFKLPRETVAELVAAGGGVCWDPGHGRAMKEWVSVLPEKVDVAALAKAAMAFVGKDL